MTTEAATTEIHDNNVGVVATRGKREIHLLGKTESSRADARALLAAHSFDRIFKASKPTPNVRNSRYLKIGA